MRELIGGCFKQFDLRIDIKSAEIQFITNRQIILNIRNCVEEEKVELKYVRTEDLFTKSIGINWNL